jgi:hypothetical protein
MDNSKKKVNIPENFNSLKEASDFWDNHSVADHLDETKEVHFDVDIKKESRSDLKLS